MPTFSTFPFEEERCIGTVCEVGPIYVKVNLPNAASADGRWLHGNRIGDGEVGEFVIAEVGDHGIFGRITNVKLPEKERLSVEPSLRRSSESHPVGTVQLLATLKIAKGEVSGGLSVHPRLGNRVFSAHPKLVAELAERSSKPAEDASGTSPREPITIHLGHLPEASGVQAKATPERLFGRHCAVLGATGGGKSYTIARLIEEVARHQSKVILLDATGEFHSFEMPEVRHVHVGTKRSGDTSKGDEVVVPYTELTEADFMALFAPGGKVQGPKLRGAIRSLKLLKLEPSLSSKKWLLKARRRKIDILPFFEKHELKLATEKVSFDVRHLAQQVDEECAGEFAWGQAKGERNYEVWGDCNEMEQSNCVTLITRITTIVQSAEMACVFQCDGKKSLFELIDDFLKSPSERVLRISSQYVPFAFGTREIVANAIGRHLLALARADRFSNSPLIVFLDEAHQFVNKSVGEEETQQKLDAFELISKEGRKYWLTICMATQRPRDIPDGVLSQMGTLIVHRLTNERDREVVEKAAGDIDRAAAAFLPTLSPGEAAIIGVDFPIPMTIKVEKPIHEPKSQGPDYQTCWQPLPKLT